MNEHVRRSGRQTVATKFFDPIYDSPMHMPQKQSQSKKTGSASHKSKELFKSDEEEEKRNMNSEIPTDSATKKQKMDVFELTSDEEIEGRENSKSLANKKGAGPSNNKTKSEKTGAGSKRKSSTKTPEEELTAPKNRKTKLEKINSQLQSLGVEPNEDNGNCTRAAIYSGSIKLTGQLSDLDQVIISGTLDCGHNCNATLGDLLEQPDYAGIDYIDGMLEATVLCDQNGDQCGGRTYVTNICTGDPYFDSGKFHNHCNKCKTFGKCIGDYRDEHCDRCGDHFWAGSGGQFGCERCGGSDSDSERCDGSGGDDCGLM